MPAKMSDKFSTDDRRAISMYKDIIEAELDQEIIDYGTEPGLRALHVVARAGDMELARALLKKRANVNFWTAKGLSPLHYAVLSGQVQMIQLLMLYGAHVDAQSKRDGRTPLYAAVERGDADIVQVLLENGASPDVSNFEGVTPKDFAKMNNMHFLFNMMSDHENFPLWLKTDRPPCTPLQSQDNALFELESPPELPSGGLASNQVLSPSENLAQQPTQQSRVMKELPTYDMPPSYEEVMQQQGFYGNDFSSYDEGEDDKAALLGGDDDDDIL